MKRTLVLLVSLLLICQGVLAIPERELRAARPAARDELREPRPDLAEPLGTSRGAVLALRPGAHASPADLSTAVQDLTTVAPDRRPAAPARARHRADPLPRRWGLLRIRLARSDG